MPTSPTQVGRGGAELRLVFACVPDALARGRLQTALRGHATLELFKSFDEIERALKGGARPATTIIALRDASGGTAAGFAHHMRKTITGTPVVVCCDIGRDVRAPIAALADAGVHDILFAGLNDQGYEARMVIFGAALGAAADVVMRAIGPSIPAELIPFVDIAVRQPRELRRVSEVAAALHIPRQTLSRWCRALRFIRPEELLVWARLFLVAALLEATPRTLESIANELRYATPASLRNRIREYTGMTSTQMRAGGVDVMVSLFTSRMEAVRESGTRRSERRMATKVG